MSKTGSFNKSTATTTNVGNTTDSITDTSGNSLTQIITALVNANTAEDLLIQNAPSLSGDNVYTGQNSFNANTQIGKSDNSSIVTIRGTQINVNGNINFNTTTTSFADIPTFASDLTPLISNDQHLVNKKYVDNMLTKNNTWTGQNTFNNGITVANSFSASANGISLSSIPTLQGSYTQPGGNCLTSREYVDGITSRQNVWNNVNNFYNDMQLGDSNVTRTISQYGNFGIHGNTTFDNLPVTATDLSSSVNNNNQLVPKKYVDTVVANANSNVYSGGVFTIASTQRVGGSWVLYAPYLGTLNTAADSTGLVLHQFYLNFSGIANQLNTAIVKFDIAYTIANPITSGVTVVGDNTVARTTTQFAGTELTLNKQLTTSCTFNVVMKPTVSDLFVGAISQTTAVIGSSSYPNTGSWTQWSNTYGSGSAVMKWYPIKIQYVNANKAMITIGCPKSQNSPAAAGVISSIQYRCECIGDVNGTYVGSQGCYFSSS